MTRAYLTGTRVRSTMLIGLVLPFPVSFMSSKLKWWFLISLTNLHIFIWVLWPKLFHIYRIQGQTGINAACHKCTRLEHTAQGYVGWGEGWGWAEELVVKSWHSYFSTAWAFPFNYENFEKVRLVINIFLSRNMTGFCPLWKSTLRCVPSVDLGQWIHLIDFPPFSKGTQLNLTSYLFFCALNPFWKSVCSKRKEFAPR